MCWFFCHYVVCFCITGVNVDPQLTPDSLQTPQPSVGSACVSGAAGSDSGCNQDGVRYFSVMWCKASKKKHKRWEGDAVLVTRGRTATLKDMEGKDIGKGETEMLHFVFLLIVMFTSDGKRSNVTAAYMVSKSITIL